MKLVNESPLKAACQNAWVLCLSGFVVTALIGCSDSSPPPANPTAAQPPAANPPAGGVSITASPNPVPAGDGNGSTMIIWNCAPGKKGEVYLSINNGPEKLFAGHAPKGQQEAPWIGAGPVYEFRLYDEKDHSTLLGSVKVTRTRKPK